VKVSYKPMLSKHEIQMQVPSWLIQRLRLARVARDTYHVDPNGLYTLDDLHIRDKVGADDVSVSGSITERKVTRIQRV